MTLYLTKLVIQELTPTVCHANNVHCSLTKTIIIIVIRRMIYNHNNNTCNNNSNNNSNNNNNNNNKKKIKFVAWVKLFYILGISSNSFSTNDISIGLINKKTLRY